MKKRIIKNIYKRIVIGGIVLFSLTLFACPGLYSIFSSTYSFSSSLAKVLYDAVKNEKVPADTVVNGDKSGAAGIIFKGLGAKKGDTLSVIHVDDSGNDANNGSTWTKAKLTIKDALDDITDASTDKLYLVLIGEGTYTPKAPLEMKNYVAIIGGFDASSNERSGYERSKATIISGGGSEQVFNNKDLDTPEKSTAVLAGVTITKGNSTDGGGMYNEKSSPTITHTIFSENEATRNGGGIYNEDDSSPKITHTIFSGNEATRNGGGIYNEDDSSPKITHTTFSGNEATRNGGGIYNEDDSSPKITYTKFSENEATRNGGGMHNEDNSSPTITHTTFSENKATEGGGGMLNNASSSPTIMYTTFFENTANNGGGMLNVSSSSPTIMYTTFSENTATKDGGGMYNFVSSSPIISSSIFWGNTDDSGNAFSQIENLDNSNIPVIVHSIVQGGYDANDSTNNIINQDPLLDTLKNNGGFVETIAITATAEIATHPAINKGLYVARKGTTYYYSEDKKDWFTSPTLGEATKEANFPADATRYTTDARGYTYKGRPDMGAYEYEGTAP